MVLIGFILFCLLGTAIASSNIYASGCRNQVLELSCPRNHRIAIKRVFYGVKQGFACRRVMDKYRGPGSGSTLSMIQNSGDSNATEDCCRASHTDCLVNDDSKYPALNTACSGQRSCKVEVKRVSTGSNCIYRAYTDYMTIIYDCVSDGNIANFCSNDKMRGKLLYLSNKEYPLPINPPKDGAECQCLVKAYNSQGISIQSVDVLLTWAERGLGECRRMLRIQDPMTYERKIQCAHRGFYGYRTIYSRPVANVTVTLSSLAGDGLAFIWLQVKATNPDGSLEILCGKTLQDVLDRIRDQELQERRDREYRRKMQEALDKIKDSIFNSDDKDKEKSGSAGTDKFDATNSTGVLPSTIRKDGLSTDMVTIIGSIVGAGFILIAIVIIAIALHCRRIHREKHKPKPFELYPAHTSEPLDLSSYCKYDYDDERLCTISRSSMKMTQMLNDGTLTNNRTPNGFITVTTAEDHQIHQDPSPSPPLPAGISTPPPSAQNQPLLCQKSYREVHYPGDLSLQFVKPLVNNGNAAVYPDYSSDNDAPVVDVHSCNSYQQGHTTLPNNCKTVLIHSGPKSPLGKRSKSVTFSQPVAMVTPLNSESEESMEARRMDINFDDECREEPSYDNLQKFDIPDKPVMPKQTEMIRIPRWEKEYRGDSPQHPLSTFQSSPTEAKIIFPAPPSDLKLFHNEPHMLSDSDDTAYTLDREYNSPSSSFWSPTKTNNGKPFILPQPQKGQLYETGV